jgi:hypothetical protein
MEAAEVMNKFFVDKVDNLCKRALLSRADAHVKATLSPMSRQSLPRPREDAPEVPEGAPNVAGEVPHVRQDTCQVPQEVAT